jgi:hypothetical protein
MNKIPIILTGPPGCGKSYWIQKYAEEIKKQLFVCPCRKDRTLREGRQKLHVWARRTEPAILWLEGADDLTPEAQAFLRRILETHASDVLFILECRDAGRLQEPIRSRCMTKRLFQPTWNNIESYLTSSFKGINTEEIQGYLKANEYSYRRAKQCAYLQLQCPNIWKSTIEHKKKENEIIKKLDETQIILYMRDGFNPEALINNLLHNESVLRDYGKCTELSGSLWAFLGSALSKETITTKNE